MRRLFAALLMATLCLPGCAWFQGTPAPIVQPWQRHRAVIHLAVSIGVGRALSGHPTEAALVYQVTKAARATLADGTLDVTQLVPFLQAQLVQPIADGETRLMLQLVVQAVAEEVQPYVQAQAPDAVVLVAGDVLDWIAEAALVPLGGRKPWPR